MANLVGRPVLDADGTRVGRVSDAVVRWDAGTAHPRVSGVLVGNHGAPSGSHRPRHSSGHRWQRDPAGSPAKNIHRLHAKQVAAIVSDLGQREQAQVAALVTPSAAAAALRELSPPNRDALLAELSDDDRSRLAALLHGDDVP